MGKVLDLPRIKKALARLDEIAEQHPEAFFRFNTTDEWEIAMTEALDPKKYVQPVSVRIAPSLLDEIDQYLIDEQGRTRSRLTRSDIIQQLLQTGLSVRQGKDESLTDAAATESEQAWQDYLSGKDEGVSLKDARAMLL